MALAQNAFEEAVDNFNENNITYSKPSASSVQVVVAPQNQKINPKSDTLEQSLSSLTDLMANATEAFTSAIFVADITQKSLKVSAVHTLSRSFIDEATIKFGCGLIGWAAENKNRISV